MSWIMTGVLALLAFAVLAWVFKAPRKGWEAIGAALLLGIAGYAVQGHPGMAGSPKAPAQDQGSASAAMVDVRRALHGSATAGGSQWLIIGDALARHGQFSEAAGVLLGAVKHNPKDAEAWLAIANALVAHADNQLTPAALFAYQRAEEVDPSQPGAPLFLGLALAQSGRFADARGVWADLLARTPMDAPWRGDLAEKLSRLDELIAQQQSMEASQ